MMKPEVEHFEIENGGQQLKKIATKSLTRFLDLSNSPIYKKIQLGENVDHHFRGTRKWWSTIGQKI